MSTLHVVRTSALVVAALFVFVACTFTRDLDYLNAGPASSSGEQPPGTSSSSGTTSSSGGTTSSSGAPAGTELVGGQLFPAHLTQDADSLYWSTDDNKIMRVAKAGGPAKQLAKAAGGIGSVLQLAVDPSPGGNLFVLLAGSIKTVSREGGELTDFLASSTASLIAVDDTFVFTASVDRSGQSTLVRYPKANASQPTVIGPPPGTDATNAGALLLHGTSVYWTFSDVDAVQICHEVPKDAPAGFATPTVWKHTGKNINNEVAGVAALFNYELAADSDGIYWVDDNDYVPYRLQRSAPQADAPKLLNAESSATSIAVDQSFIYVLTTDRIIKLSKSDPTKRDAYPIDADSQELVTDATSLYWLFPGDDVKPTGSIRKLAK